MLPPGWRRKAPVMSNLVDRRAVERARIGADWKSPSACGAGVSDGRALRSASWRRSGAASCAAKLPAALPQAIELSGLCGAGDCIAATAAEGAPAGARSAMADDLRPARHKPIVVWASFNFFLSLVAVRSGRRPLPLGSKPGRSLPSAMSKK